MTFYASALVNPIRVYFASDGRDENSLPVPALRLSAGPAPQRNDKSPPHVPPPHLTKWAIEYSEDTWERDVRIYVYLSERFHPREYTKTNILKQVSGGTGKAYRDGIERLTVSTLTVGPWIEMELTPPKSINNVGIWLVTYAINRRKADLDSAELSLQCLLNSGKLTTKVIN
jgi:hypothetical protein